MFVQIKCESLVSLNTKCFVINTKANTVIPDFVFNVTRNF